MDSETRIERLKGFLEEDPDDPFTRFALAQEYLKDDRVEEARDLFETLVEEHPDYVGTYYHLGKLYERLGREEEAIETYDRGIEVAEEQADTHAKSELQDARMQALGIGFDD